MYSKFVSMTWNHQSPRGIYTLIHSSIFGFARACTTSKFIKWLLADESASSCSLGNEMKVAIGGEELLAVNYCHLPLRKFASSLAHET